MLTIGHPTVRVRRVGSLLIGSASSDDSRPKIDDIFNGIELKRYYECSLALRNTLDGVLDLTEGCLSLRGPQTTTGELKPAT